MNTAKLTDFTTDQLQVLLDVIVAKIVDEDNHRKEWLRWFKTFNSGGYYENQPHRLETYRTLCLWRVQILNAIGKVGIAEQINNN